MKTPTKKKGKNQKRDTENTRDGETIMMTETNPNSTDPEMHKETPNIMMIGNITKKMVMMKNTDQPDGTTEGEGKTEVTSMSIKMNTVTEEITAMKSEKSIVRKEKTTVTENMRTGKEETKTGIEETTTGREETMIEKTENIVSQREKEEREEMITMKEEKSIGIETATEVNIDDKDLTGKVLQETEKTQE